MSSNNRWMTGLRTLYLIAFAEEDAESKIRSHLKATLCPRSEADNIPKEFHMVAAGRL
jgi:hypothetical protein